MAKVEEQISRDYLEKKLNTLFEQKDKVEDILNTYLELNTKIAGAIEITKELLTELNVRAKIEVKKDE